MARNKKSRRSKKDSRKNPKKYSADPRKYSTKHSKKASMKDSRKNSKRHNVYIKNTAAIALAAALILVLDLFTKILVRKALAYGGSVIIINNFFAITNTSNTGVAFSFLQNNVWIPIWLSIITIGLILIFHDTVRSTTEGAFLGLILGGIIGNLIDRLAFGAVTDFIAFSFWPAFNIADSALTIGVAGLIICYILNKRI